ncbi:MAG: hypothetical protein GWP06_10915 [Actinobacteria bacterium]|nr:hypothetical protein [Actinomycetota bacterium]
MNEHFNPWSSIWLKPKETIRTIIETNPRQNIMLLAFLGGIGQAFANAAAQGMGKFLPIPTLITVVFLAGPLGGLLYLYLGGWLLQIIGQRFGGGATKEELQAAIAWSWVPIVSTLPLWGVKYILFRNEVFSPEKTFTQSQPVLANLHSLIGFVDFVIIVWSLYIFFNAVSEVNRFSFGRSIATILIAGLIITIPSMLLLALCAPALHPM